MHRVAAFSCKCIVFFMSIYLIAAAVVYAQPNSSPKVLILNSYHKGFRWTDNQVSAAEKVLSEEDMNFNLYIEYMDTKRIYNDQYLKHLSDIYRLKYRKSHLDAIIATDDNALWFVLKHHEKVFGRAPVAFCGINNYKKSLFSGKHQLTGLVEVLDIKLTIDLALKLRPHTRKIVVVVDSTPTGTGQKKDIVKAARHYNNLKFEFIEGKDHSHSNLYEKLRLLPQDSIVLLAVWLRDKSDVYLSPDEGGRLISSNSTVPVFGIIDMYYGLGIVGGKLLNSRTHGRIAAEMAIQVINGEKPSNIPVIFKSTNPYMFDYKQLKRWKISPSDLPKNSIIINKPISFYNEYRRLIWVVTGVFAFLILIVLMLTMNLLHRKKAENALRESEARHRAILQTAMDGFWLVDQEGRLLEVNEAYCRMSGYEEEELQNMRVSDLEAFDTPEEITANIEKIVSHGEARFERKHRHKNGGVFDVEISVQYQPEMGGRFFSFVRDITQRKKDEFLIQESEERYRVLSAVTIEGIVIHKGGVIIDTNDSFKKIFGYGLEELTGKNILDLLVHQEDRRIVEQRIIKNRAEPYVIRAVKRNGDIFFAEIEARNFQMNDEILRVASFRDITKRKESERALIESENIYKTFINSTPDFVFLKDSNFKHIVANRALADFLGKEPEEIIGLTDFDLMPKEAATICRASDQKAMEVDSVFISEEHIANRIFESIKFPVVLDENKTGVGCYIRDITKRKQTEMEGEQLQFQLNQARKMESVGRLAGGVAHDYNNMLSVILGYSEMLLETFGPQNDAHAAIAEIQNAARRSADITRQLLAFARQQTISPRVLDLNDTVQGMLKMLRRLIGEDIDLVWMPGGALWPVKMDPSQVDQILANLCVNARDAISSVGKVTIETENARFDDVSCADHSGLVVGEYVLLAVSDDGDGMDSETLENIFEPFFTTKAEGLGTGLGLATVYGIVKQNEGFINVYSEPGKGTTFRIYLPRDSRQKIEEAVDKVAEIPQGRGETVLLVEDEAAILALGKQMLQRLGYQVLSAGHPKEALTKANRHDGRIDLLVTDVVMPEMSGRALSEALVARFSNVKTLYLSGYTADVIAQRGVLEKGMNFMQKPFSKIDLAVKVREVLDGDSQ